MTIALGIGGAALRLSPAPDGEVALEAPCPPAAAFARGAAAEATPTIEVTVRVGIPAVPPGASALFRTGSAWSLHGEGERRHLALDPPGIDAPWWVASTDRHYRRVELCAHPRLADDTMRPPVLRRLVGYPLDQLLLLHALAGEGGLVVHAAGAIAGDRALLFPGPSGGGKTTLTRLLAGNDSLRLLSDDRIVLRAGAGPITAWGTPWPGDAGVADPGCAPLGAVCVLAHGDRTRLRALTARAALERLVQVVSVPWHEPGLLPGALGALERLVEDVPVVCLEFRRDGEGLQQVLETLPRAA